MGQQVYFAAEGNAGNISKISTTLEIIQLSLDPYNVIIIIVPCSPLGEYNVAYPKVPFVNPFKNDNPSRACDQSMDSFSTMS